MGYYSSGEGNPGLVGEVEMSDLALVEREAERAGVPLVEYLMESLAHSQRIAGENAQMWAEAQDRIEQLDAAVAFALDHIDEDHYYTLGNMAAVK
jgi:hypothetical protein